MSLRRVGVLPGVLTLAMLWALTATPGHAARLFALVNTGEVFVSADQGVTWSIQSTVAVYDAVALQARHSSTDLFMAGASGSVYRSIDSGMNWSAVGAPPVSDLVDMTIRGDGDIVILTASGDIYRSTDLGATFTPLATLTASNFTSLAGRSDGHLFALTRTGEVYSSIDGGGAWAAVGVVTSPDAVRIRASGTTLHVITSTGTTIGAPTPASPGLRSARCHRSEPWRWRWTRERWWWPPVKDMWPPRRMEPRGSGRDRRISSR